jgi:aryl-alcohol dehydrogenase-like predicted oxidoreductase/HEAT repeat protein
VCRLHPGDDGELFELRDALVGDADAEVRTAAVLQLDAAGAARLLPYLHEATRDASMRVREAAFVALARARDTASLHRAAHACRYDRGFRVRRMALLFATRVCGAGAQSVLAIASRDPFWRVRVAARRAAAALDAAVDLRPIGDPPPASVDVAGVEDPDPAVVAARLARMQRGLDPALLVGALGHSHHALRRIAVREIGARGDLGVLRAVTTWLSDDRVPYGPAAAEATLARSGARGAAVAAALLDAGEPPDPGRLAWAVRAAIAAPPWPQLSRLLTEDDPRLRRAAAARVPEAAPERGELLVTMRRMLEDEDEGVRCTSAAWLARSASRDARAVLRAVDPRGQPALVRMLLVEPSHAAADVEALRALAADAHGGVRASAVSALSALGALSDAERRALEGDPDPWVRGAVLGRANAGDAVHDASVEVRRSAVELLDDVEARRQWAESATGEREPDASLRARAASTLADARTMGATRALLRFARDHDLGVRSAATHALETHHERVRRLLDAGALDAFERIAAYTLFRLSGEPLRQNETDPAARAHLALLDDALSGRAPQVAAPAAAPERPPCPHRRELGRTGLLVSPLGISGAHGLAFDDFALAHDRGVDLFFWEPSHRELARFLRARRRTIVACGTYHGDAPSLERDVARALRALGRDTLDVFLAFWTRSAARLDEVLGPLVDLRRRGLIRAAGISTHDRALACDAVDRGLDVVMVRHSAAHRGAESTVLPHAAAHGTGVLTFSNLCYGRMLHRTPAALTSAVTAPDCYRYSLSQHGVHACIAAPRRYSELLEDLAVVESPKLAPERQAELRAHGAHVYARSKAWSAETWSVADAPTATAGEALDEWVDRPESISAGA